MTRIDEIKDEIRKKAPFLRRFQSEIDRRKYLYYWRWPKGFVCPHCKAKKKYYSFKRRGKIYYQCKECSKETSLLAGTVFEKTKIPLKTWFLGFCIIKKVKCSISDFQRALEIEQYKTAWNLYYKIKSEIKSREKFKLLFHSKTRKRWEKWKEKNRK